MAHEIDAFTSPSVAIDNELKRLRSNGSALERENERLVKEVAAWQERFPDYFYELESDSIIKD